MPAKRKAAARGVAPLPAPDFSGQLARIKRIRGQIEGIQRMVEDRRATSELIVQIAAARAALRSLEAALLRGQANQYFRPDARRTAAHEARLEEILALFLRAAG